MLRKNNQSLPVYILPNGINLDKFKVEKKPEKFVVGFAGRIAGGKERGQKGVNMAAQVVRKILTDEEYADAEYRRFLKEKDKYVDFDEFCRKEEI